MTFSKDFHVRRGIKIIIGLVVIILVAVAVREFTKSRSTDSSAAKAPAAVPVTAAVATRADVPDTINAIGSVQSIDSVAIQPRVTGTIVKIEFSPGQDVKKDQELFLIDPRPYQAAVDQAKAQLAKDEAVLQEAQIDLTRYQTLEKQKSIAGQQAQDQVFVVEQDKGTVELDQANLETAQLNLAYCHITSPIDGRAGALQVDLGNMVGPSATSGTTSSSTAATSSRGLVSIAQLQPIYVTFNVAQTALDQIQHSQAVQPLEVDVYAQGGKLLAKGQLTLIDNQVNTATGTVLLQATFANADNALWPGEYVSVTLIVTTRRNVVTVPASAVMIGPNGNYVYVIGADDKVRRVDIQQTARQGGVAVIGKGISAGQKVVTAGQIRLDNGSTVAIQQTAAPQAHPGTATE